MSAIIKASARDMTVRALGPRTGEARTIDNPVARAEAALAVARAEIADLNAALTQAKREGKVAEKTAREAGRREGLDTADKKAAERLLAIQQGVSDARRIWDARLAELDALAALLSRAALRKIFTPDADLADLTARAIAKQMATLSGETVVAIRVSTADFDESAALDTSGKTGAITVIPDKALASGACRFDLLLGSRDVGPREQWTVLETFLDGLIDEVRA